MYRRILVAVDGSSTSQLALAHALQLAYEQRAEVRIVHAIEWIEHLAMSFAGGYQVDMTEFSEAMRREGERVLEEAKAAAVAAGVHGEIVLLVGKEPEDRTARMLAHDARDWKADLIVVGTHGRSGVDRFVLGSVAESLIRATRLPVLLVHGE